MFGVSSINPIIMIGLDPVDLFVLIMVCGCPKAAAAALVIHSIAIRKALVYVDSSPIQGSL
jgi:hypothetical protein